MQMPSKAQAFVPEHYLPLFGCRVVGLWDVQWETVPLGKLYLFKWATGMEQFVTVCCGWDYYLLIRHSPRHALSIQDRLQSTIIRRIGAEREFGQGRHAHTRQVTVYKRIIHGYLYGCRLNARLNGYYLVSSGLVMSICYLGYMN